MKKTILIISASVFIYSCGPSQAELNKKRITDSLDHIIKTTGSDIDSIQKYYDHQTDLIKAGLTNGQAKAVADAIASNKINTIEQSDSLMKWVSENVK